MSKGRHPAGDNFIDGMKRMGQGALGRQILDALEEVTWTQQPSPTGDPFKSRLWQGKAHGFIFTVFDFEVESQGYPGERGANGAVIGDGGFVVRLTQDLAEHAVELAREQAGIT